MEAMLFIGTVSVGMYIRKLGLRRHCLLPKIGTEKSHSGPYIISLDQGTSSSRAVLYDKNCEAIISHQVATHCERTSDPEWAEQDPFTILKSSQECINQVIMKAKSQFDLNLNNENVLGLGVTNQRETTIIWDSMTGNPLYNAILWYDNRTSEIVKEFISKYGSSDIFRQKTGLVLSTYFSALKLCWLLKNVEAVREAISKKRCMFGTVDSWLIWNLTGGPNKGIHCTDVTNASRTMLMNIESLDWDSELLSAFSIPVSILPSIKSSSEYYGSLQDDQINDEIKGVPILSCLGDQQAALVGHLCMSEGSSKCTYGTGCFMLYNTGNKIVNSTNGLLTTLAYQLGPTEKPVYALEGSIAVAGLGFKWIKDNLGAVKSVNDIDSLVTSIPDNGGVYFVPAFTGLLAPYWNLEARGIVVGVTQQTTAAHISRAMVESIAYNANDIVKAAISDSNLQLNSIVVDGGASKSDFLLQMQSNMCQVPVFKPKDTEATCRGAAIAAGLAAGLYDINTLYTQIGEKEKTYFPKINLEEKKILENAWDFAVRMSCLKAHETMQ